MNPSRRKLRVDLLLLAALLVAAVFHLGVSRQSPDLVTALQALLSSVGLASGVDPIDEAIVVQFRLPRLVLALFGGASLGLAGAVMQAAFRNPLASPDIVGTAAGAAFGGAIAIVSKLAALFVLAVPIASLGGAMIVTWLVFALGGIGGRFSTTGLLLAGVALNTLVGALTTFVVSLSFANYAASSEVLFWLMGGLDRASWTSAEITMVGAILFGGLIAVTQRNGGTAGLSRAAQAFTGTRMRAQLCAYGLGFVVFFDDYSHILIVGNALKPIMATLALSREKFAFVIHSMGARV